MFLTVAQFSANANDKHSTVSLADRILTLFWRLIRQLQLEGKEERQQLYFHQQLLNDKLPLSIGGGIGQSRLCMVLLHKAHIGEIQASIWPDDMREECKKMGMNLI